MNKVLALVLFASVTTQAQSLRVRPHVVVSPGADVKLSHLVDAQGLSNEANAQLSEISLSRAPAFGERQELANASLTAALRPVLAGERARGKKVQIVIPKIVIVDTVKRGITSARVQTELIQAWQPLCQECKLEIEGLSLPAVDRVQDWTLKIKSEIPRGSFSVPVEIVRDNGSPLPAWISGRLIVKKNVPVAKRLMAPGERLAQSDISWEYRDTSYSVDSVPQEEELEGRHVKQGLRAGDILWRSNLERMKAVRRGDLVTVRSGETGWEVSMSVIAQADAYVGDTVNLKNPRTNQPLVGRVTGQGEVDIQ